MNVIIEYCTSWGYYNRAAGLADIIEKKLSVKPTLKQSSGGVFEVYVNGDLIYSKKATGIFPNEDKIIKKIEELNI